jgi:hypothetical protein
LIRIQVGALAIVALCLLSPLHAADTEEDEVASLAILVSTTFGEAVEKAPVVLTSVGPKTRFLANGSRARFARIPYGLYDVDIRLPGFLPRLERIRVYQRDLVIRMSLALAPTHAYERPELSGLIASSPTRRSEMWVRLVALHSSDLIENAVDDSGKFELDGMVPGQYVLLVLHKTDVLAAKPLEILGGKQLVRIPIE